MPNTMTWKGAWVGDGSNLSVFAYIKDDAVKYNGIVYVSTSNNIPIGSPSPDLDMYSDMSNWDVVVIDGTSGQSGSAGTSGENGEAGTSGTSGETGNSGTSGTSGENGEAGTSGQSGSSGTSGETGLSGSSGTSGETGLSGSSGTSGNSGTSGENGSAGTSGTSGIDGTSGTSGGTGSSGTSGESGVSGSSGTSGEDGSSGTSGESGVSGSSGTSGQTGSSGTSGGTGASGSSGSSGTSSPGILNYAAQYSDSSTQPITEDGITTISCNTTDYQFGISLVSGNRFTVPQDGQYEFGFSAQIEKTQGGTATNITFWISVNNLDIPGSASTVTLVSNSAYQLPFVPYILDLNAGDYVQLRISADHADCQLTAIGAQTLPTRPASPSVIIVFKQVGTAVGSSSGTSGSAGTSGSSGSTGSAGSSGSTGTSGTSGSTGTSGSSGSTGSSGSSGSSGSTGSSGSAGTAGSSGSSWTSPYSGQVAITPFVGGDTTANTTINFSNGNIQTFTLNASTTFAFSNALSGGTYVIIVRQNASTPYTVTFTGAKWPTGVAPIMTQTLNRYDIYTFVTPDASTFFGTYTQDYA